MGYFEITKRKKSVNGNDEKKMFKKYKINYNGCFISILNN